MAKRDEFRRLFCGHDAGEAGDTENIALRNIAVQDEPERFRHHGHATGGHSLTQGIRLSGDVNHARRAVVIKMGQFFHAQSPSFPWRIVKILRLNLLIAFAFQCVLNYKLASPLKIG